MGLSINYCEYIRKEYNGEEQHKIFSVMRRRRISRIDCASIHIKTLNITIKFNRDLGIKEDASPASYFNF